MKVNKWETVGIQLRRYIKSGGEPLAIYECIFRTEDWEKDRMKFINIMNGIGKLADKEMEERAKEKADWMSECAECIALANEEKEL